MAWVMPTAAMVLVHYHLHGASSETVVSPSASHHMVHATLSSIVPSSQPHNAFGPTSSYILSGIRGHLPALSLSLPHHLWLSQGLMLPLCNLYCSSSNVYSSHAVVVQGTPARLSPYSHHFRHGLQKLKFKRGTLSCFSLLHLCSDSPNLKAVCVECSSCLGLCGARTCWCGRTPVNIFQNILPPSHLNSVIN